MPATLYAVPTPSSRQYLSVDSLCAELGVARSTFYEWRAKRRGPRCVRLPNGKIRIRRAEFERWLDTLEEDLT